LTKDFSQFDLEMTRRALELAAKGVGLVSPNPLVGCVIVSESGQVVGEGFYTYDGVTHAEVIALNQAGDRAKGGTAYVSLEPHGHHGKTPPCTDALINAGIKRVVSPIEDPNPKVSGEGFEQLRNAGVEVVTGILAEEASRQNEAFICWHKKKRPFVHLKLAMSIDGRISLKKSVSTTLSGSDAIKRVHEIRHGADAILVGGNTAFVDDPSLTDRSGLPRRRPLVRVVLDNRLRILTDSTLVTTAHETPTLVFSNSTDEEKIEALFQRGVQVPRIDARDLDAVLHELYEREIQSVLVEGGTEVAGAFCDANLVDKFTFMVAPIIIGGHDAPTAIGGNGATSVSSASALRKVQIRQHGADFEITGYPELRQAEAV
jgi:diaminohydroxyphosphoribosylaminopyrimidine deaminase/5-amino-6-(5-phosphoribosylamino)uracil reductase